jgi:hypothetical protein
MHDAVELLMLAVLDHVQAPANKRREFLDFWPDIRKTGLQDPPDFIAMDSLNRLRVALKHSGNTPNPDNVRGLFPRTKGFFENVLALYCGLNYEDVSFFEAIPNSDVKKAIRDAQDSFTSGDKNNAMVELAKAMIALERPRDSHLPKLVAPQLPSITRQLRDLGFDRYFQQLHAFLEGSAALTNAQTFGYNPFEYQAFKGLLPHVNVSMAGTYQASLWLDYSTLDLNDFKTIVDYLVGLSLKLGETYQPIRPSVDDTGEQDVISVAQKLVRIRVGAAMPVKLT